MRFITVVLAALIAASAPAAGPVTFVPHDIDAGFKGGYAVGVADFNKDGKLDVIANSIQATELAWYENPTWARHVIVPEMRQIVNQAMADIDGDGIPEIAFQSAFAMQPANSVGDNWIARHQGDVRKPWKIEKIDSFPTSHHVVWLDLDGNGRVELVNAPLIGAKGLAPTYDQDKAPLFWYSPKDWARHVIADDIPGIIHRVRAVRWDDGKRDQLLVASFDGIALYSATDIGTSMKFTKRLLSRGHVEKAPRLGASDAGAGKQDGKRFFASIEPWHGNEVAIYTEKGGDWVRRVIFDKVGSGHEIAVVDLNGDGRDDVVVNDNSRPSQNNPNAPVGGVHVFFAPDDAATGEWQYRKIEDKAAMNSCVGADINGDRRNDIVCVGGGAVLRWYENKGSGRVGALVAATHAASDRLSEATKLLETYVAQQKIAGAVAAVAQKGNVIYLKAVGVQDLEPRAPMTDRSIFRIYSMTKPVTAAGAMILHEEGRFNLTDPVSKYIPEFKQLRVATADGGTRAASREVTVEDLLLHTSGLSHRNDDAYRRAQVRSRAIALPKLMENMARVPLMEDPGTRYRYSEGPAVVGRLIEIWSGKPLEVFFDERIFTPLRMTDTAFWVRPEHRARLATVYAPVSGGGFRPFEMEPELPFTERPALLEGSAGLVSTLPDYLRFAQMLLNKGALDGVRILKAATVDRITANGLGEAAQRTRSNGMGWGLANVEVARGPASRGEYGWNGSAGTSFWIDPTREVIGILMTQSAPANPDQIRQRFKAIVDQTFR